MTESCKTSDFKQSSNYIKLLIKVNWLFTFPFAVFVKIVFPNDKLAVFAIFSGIDVYVAPVSIMNGIGTLFIKTTPL